MFSVTYKMEMAHVVPAVRDLAGRLAEHGGRQRGAAEAGRTQQVQGWHRAAGVPIQERGQRRRGDSSSPLVSPRD